MATSGYTIVTGASSGIGLELAKGLAEQRRPLVLVARREEILKRLAEEWKKQFAIDVKVIVADLTKESEVQKVIDAVRDLPLKGLINNAGIGGLASFWERSWELQKQMMNLNIMALVQLTHGLLPRFMEQKDGQILNVASTAAFQPGPYLNVYSATKAFVLSFSEALNEELRGTGVTVTALCPGLTESEFHTKAGTDKVGKALNIKLAPARDVALFGLRAMERGCAVAIPGMANRALAFSARHLPKPWVSRVAAKVLRPREN